RAVNRFFSSPARPPTAPYPLSLHDALPISSALPALTVPATMPWMARSRTSCSAFPTKPISVTTTAAPIMGFEHRFAAEPVRHRRSEEHTSELQSRFDLVCRLLLEKKNLNLR